MNWSIYYVIHSLATGIQFARELEWGESTKLVWLTDEDVCPLLYLVYALYLMVSWLPHVASYRDCVLTCYSHNR